MPRLINYRQANLPGIVWRDQALAIWLPLAEPACARHFGDWHIPYLNRN